MKQENNPDIRIDLKNNLGLMEEVINLLALAITTCELFNDTLQESILDRICALQEAIEGVFLDYDLNYVSSLTDTLLGIFNKCAQELEPHIIGITDLIESKNTPRMDSPDSDRENQPIATNKIATKINPPSAPTMGSPVPQ